MTGTEFLFLVSYGLLVQNPIHAGTHALTTKVIGGEVISFKPYPGFHNNGKFTMDSVRVKYTSLNQMQLNRELGWTPQWVNSAIFTTTIPIADNIESNQTKRYVMLAGMFAPLIDASFNYGVRFLPYYKNRNDYGNINTTGTIAIGVLIAGAWYYVLNEWGKTE
jgi:hypothetical protein